MTTSATTLPVRKRAGHQPSEPYVGPVSQNTDNESAPLTAARVVDLRNLVLITAGCIVLILLIPPQHEYPIIDDWIYAASVQDVLNTGKFVMPDWSQANLVGLVYWGVLWSKLLGFSFTTLTYSTLSLGLCGLFAFYGIARLVDVPPRGALLGTALLGLNPMVLYLAYSFMTDVPFIAVMLMSCYFYMRGLRSERLGWIWAGGLLAGWAYLMRQFAVLIPIGFAAYLALEGLLARKWRWQHILLAGLVPLHFVVGWFFWTHDWPQTWASASAGSRSAQIVMQPVWLSVSWFRTISYLPFLAYFAWVAIKLPRRQWWLIPAWAILIVFGMYNADTQDENNIQQVEPEFFVQLGPWLFKLPNRAFTFGQLGSLFRLNGIDFEVFYYPQERVWTPEAWRAIWCLGVLLGAALAAKITASLFEWLRAAWLSRRITTSPVMAFYLVGALIFVASVALPGDTYARYALGYTPFVVLFVVRGCRSWGSAAWAYTALALVLVGGFGLLAKADQVEHMNVRWQAALWFERQVGGPVHMGWDWSHWGHGDSETYRITSVPTDGWRTERKFPYICRLCGFTTRYVTAESTADMPLLPSAP